MGSLWNNNYEWCFSLLGTGDKVGVNNAGIGIFKKQPYIGLAKEILQNVIDAKDPDIKGPAKACFEVIRVGRDAIPGADYLSEVIKRCYEYYHEGDDGIKMGLLKDAAEYFLDRDVQIPILKISDYNTTGLTGAHSEKGSNWTGLVREISATNKGNGLSGSFGVGKFAPFNFSRLRTILYSTYNKDKEAALQGKTILTTFRDSEGKLRQNVGLFGRIINDDCQAIYDIGDIPKVFRRDRYGTDLFVLGFREDTQWMHQVAISVLEYFFYTIFIGNLEVSISDGEVEIEITKKNLSDHMNNYRQYCERQNIEFSAPLFWEILNDTSGQTKHIKEPFRRKGNVELYFRLDPEFAERRILEMRTAGMKIQEDTGFRIGANFRGIFIATGEGSKSEQPEDNINSFLRKCENQAHDTWSKDEYEENRDEADRIIKGIHKWILEKIKAEIPEMEADETAAYGLSDLLPNQDSDGKDDQQEAAFATFEPRPVIINQTPRKNAGKKSSDVNVISTGGNPLPEDIIVPFDGGEETTSGGGTEPTQRPDHPPYPGPYPGPFPGTDPTAAPKPDPDGPQNVSGKKDTDGKNSATTMKLHALRLLGLKTPYDSATDTFRVSFVPDKTADMVYLKLRIGVDDDNKPNADIQSATCEGKVLGLSKGFIILRHIEKGKKVVVSTKLSNAKRCSLEVTAYAK